MVLEQVWPRIKFPCIFLGRVMTWIALAWFKLMELSFSSQLSMDKVTWH